MSPATACPKYWTAAAAVSAALYGDLPERVPTHFDLNGVPNGFMSRPWAAAFLPALALVMWAFVRLVPRVLPAADRERLSGPIVALVAALPPAFVAAIPRVKRNPIIGIRTAWTLRSDENWARTQRLGGRSMILAGIGAALAGAIGGAIGGFFAIACIVLAALVPVTYSFFLARRNEAS